MIFTAPSQFNTLPVQDMTPADRAFLRSEANVKRPAARR
ncbi:MAG: hypothetical protein ACK5MQ_17030 [Pikeienuella sp.]